MILNKSAQCNVVYEAELGRSHSLLSLPRPRLQANIII